MLKSKIKAKDKTINDCQKANINAKNNSNSMTNGLTKTAHFHQNLDQFPMDWLQTFTTWVCLTVTIYWLIMTDIPYKVRAITSIYKQYKILCVCVCVCVCVLNSERGWKHG